MATDFKDNAIKRFTYDWLIRFAELHPFEVPESLWGINSYRQTSKYSAISPCFTTVISRHMPYVYCSSGLYKNECQQMSDTFLRQKLTIVICNSLNLPDLTSYYTLFLKNRVFFFATRFSMYDNSISMTSDQLKYMLKNCSSDCCEVRADLLDPMPFSDIWPFLKRCRDIRVYILKNLIFGDNIVNLIRGSCPECLVLGLLDVSEKTVLELFDFLLSLPNYPRNVHFAFTKEHPISLAEAIVAKFNSYSTKTHDLSELTTFQHFSSLRKSGGSRRLHLGFYLGPM
uniref:F-box domain-containing protein n=1 Tax=Panagrellus redivivus TaxID=6233 RepID=A0A7E4UY25_PANRE